MTVGDKYTITLQGGATIDSGGLQLSGGGGIMPPSQTTQVWRGRTDQFTLEIPATSDTVAAARRPS